MVFENFLGIKKHINPSSGKFFLVVFLFAFFIFPLSTFAATRTISNAGGNWSATGTWVEGQVPTSGDDVVATATSGNVTIDSAATARSIDLSSYTATLTHDASITLSIGDANGGALNFSGSWTYTTAADTSAIKFASSSNNGGSGWPVTSGGKLFGNVSFFGTGKWVLQDSFISRSTNAQLVVRQGTFDTNNQILSIGHWLSNYTDTKIINLGSSQITVNQVGDNDVWAMTSAGTTFNSGTSVINIIGQDADMSGSFTFHEVRFTGAGIHSMPNAATFTNLVVIGTASKTGNLLLYGDISVTGTFNVDGNSATNRILVSSNTLGTARTITAANVSVTNTDFRDITGAGTGNWNLSAISGGSGDAGGNSGITFTTAATQYWKHGATASVLWSTAGNWFLATNGGGGAGRVPLPQDNVVFDANSFTASGKTVQADMPRLGKSVSWAGVTNSPTWSINNGTAVTLYGSLTLSSNLTLVMYNLGFIFEGRGAATLTTAGKNITYINVAMVGGTLVLQDNLTCQYGGSPQVLTLSNGTLDAQTNNVNVTTDGFLSSNSNTRSLLRGSGTWTITGTAAADLWNVQIATGMTFDSNNNSTIVLADTGSNSKGFYGGGLTYNNIIITGGGTGAWTFKDSNSFKNFTINAPKTVKFEYGKTQTITGLFTAIGSTGNLITLSSNNPGSPATLSKASGVVTDNYLSIQDITATGGANWYAGANSTNVSGNSGWNWLNFPGIFYSVGQSASDLKTGTPNVTIAAGAATFSVAQTGNIGVGDRVTYNTNQVAYISAKTNADSAHWNLVTATGGIPGDISNSTVVSITREFTSLAAAIAGSSNAQHINNTDLTAANVVLNIPAYYDTGADTTAVTVSGYTTSASNYIKIYTPNNTSTEANISQRHQGTFSGNYYSLLKNNDWGQIIDVEIDNVQIVGLVGIATQNNTMGIVVNSGSLTTINNVLISGNLLKSTATAPSSSSGGIKTNFGSSTSTNQNLYVINNIVNGFYNGVEQYSPYNGYGSLYVYNNTVTNSVSQGFRNNTNSAMGSYIYKNNIAYNNATDWSVNFDTGTTNNLSKDATAPGTNAKTSTTVSFADSANKDFHLSPNDTSARNAGADLSADANFAITTDIDGQIRPTGANSVDIGADEAATAVYYSVGQNTNDHKTGTPTIDISNGTATFSVAQTATNMGVGDKVTYNTSSVAYISQKISTTQWKLITATGGTPADVTGQTVNSIAHAFNSLNAAVAGASGASYLNTSDLVAGNYQLNISAYYDSGADTTPVTVQNYTTSPANYIKIYTPNNTSTEANVSQRHQGKWDDGKYNLSVSSVNDALRANVSNMVIEGLQINQSFNADYYDAISVGSDVKNVRITHNILKDTGATNSGGGVSTGGNSNTSYPAMIYVLNNIFYGWKSPAINIGSEGDNGVVVANNTIYGTATCGINQSSYYDVIAKNNLSYGSGTSDYCTTNSSSPLNYAASSTNNLGSGAAVPGSNAKINQTVSFTDAANKDYHLNPTDTSAKNAGADLSADANFAFNTDIDGQSRSAQGGFDIGADEAATAVYYSVGQNTNDHKTGSPTVTIANGTATFSVAQTATNMGVGDKVTYNTTSVAYISAKISQTQWKLITATGGTPADVTGQTVNSITHAFNSLNAAVTGASGASYLNTSDLVAGNYQLNIPAYYDSGADTTPVTVQNYTTSPANYIKIYTPSNTSTEANNSQRHQGKWDDGKYNLNPGSSALSIFVNNVKMEGVQVASSRSTAGSATGVLISLITAASDLQFSGNIFKGSYSGAASGGKGIWVNDPDAVVRIYNNIFYGFGNGAAAGFYAIDGSGSSAVYAYNNTAYMNYVGIYSVKYAKNNIATGNITDYSGAFDASSTNNISQDATSPNAVFRNKTVSFVDSANKDLHLSPNDTDARNAGADLSADANFAFNTDIDGQSRSSQGGFDIGADEAANSIYYSVGQSASDLKTGTPTVTISGGVAVFSVAQSGNIGVGDRVTYNTNQIAYISAKTNVDQMHWSLVTATGAVPVDISNSTVVSITREYTSLASAIAGALDANHINNPDLTSANVVLNIPAYYDTGADTTPVTVSGYTTSVSNYIKIYTPSNTSTEANNSQRHQGKWDDKKYNLTKTNASGMLNLSIPYVTILGLQVGANGFNGGYSLLVFVTAEMNATIIGNIFQFKGNSGASSLIGSSYLVGLGKIVIANNLLTSDGPLAIAISNYRVSFSTETWLVYNNTIIGGNGIAVGINSSFDADGVIAINNVFKDNLKAASGTFAAGSDYNVTSNSSMSYTVTGGGNTHDKVSQNIKLSDGANRDFHLDPNDTTVKNAGMNLSADANFAFNTDIDGQARTGTWDVGADEAATAIYYSVGQNTNDHKTGTPTIDISNGTATFSTAQTATNMGVGDKVTYNGATVAYISGKISQTQWKLSTATGTVPGNVTGQTVNSITHAFASLNAAVTGASGASYLNTSDLVAGNYQLNMSLYYDMGQDVSNNVITVNSWKTSPANYIKIYTPTSIANEANTNQRHQGKWDDGKYNLLVNGNFTGIYFFQTGYVTVEGLQISHSNPSGQYGLLYQNSVGTMNLKNNIIRSTGSGGYGIFLNDNKSTFNVSNNLIYGFNGGYGGLIVGMASYIYNNTFTDSDYGIWGNSNTVAKNNIVNASVDGYYNPFSASSNYNISNLAADAPGANSKNSTTVSFIDVVNKDFHLAPNDTAAKKAGISLQNDANFAFSTDIDGQERAGNWDIGADEFRDSQMQMQVSAPNLNNGLIGRWTFDGTDINGNIAKDISGNNNDGTISNAVPVAGKLGQGLDFNGSNSSVSLNDKDSLSPNRISVFAWIKRENNNSRIISKDDNGGSRDYELKITSANKIEFTVWNESNVLKTVNTGSIVDNNWHFVGGIWDGNNITTYLDGVQQAMDTLTGTSVHNGTSNLVFGKMRTVDNQENFKGGIDDVRLYNRALTLNEIGQLYHLGQVEVRKTGTTVIRK